MRHGHELSAVVVVVVVVVYIFFLLKSFMVCK